MLNKQNETQWFACDLHLESILDEIVDHQAIAPSIELWNKDNFPEALCEQCGKPPHYILIYLANGEAEDADSIDHCR